MPLHLQLSAALTLDHHAGLDGQDDTGGDDDVAGQSVGAVGRHPGGGLGNDAADIGVPRLGQYHLGLGAQYF